MIQYIVALKNSITGPARVAQGSMLNLGAATKKAQADLSAYQKQLALSKAIGDIEGYRKYTALVDQQKRSLFSLNNALLAEKAAAGEAAGGTSMFSSALAALGGPAGIAMAVVGSILAVSAAFTAAVIAGARFAIEVVGLKEKLTTAFDALGNGPEAGKKTMAMLDNLSSKLPQTRTELAGWTKTYMALGMTDLGALRGQLLATASAQSLMGEAGVDAYQSLTKRIQEAIATNQGLKLSDKQLAGQLATTGANVIDVAARMGLSAQVLRNQLKAGTVDARKFGDALQTAIIAKGAGPLSRMGLELGTQWSKFKENIGKLFEGVNPGPFLVQMRSLLGIFDASKPSAQALKAGVTGFFNATFASAAKVVPYVKHFFLDLVILGLKAYIALKPIVGWGRSFLQSAAGLAIVRGVVLGTKVALGALAAAIGVVLVAAGAIAAIAAAVNGAFVAMAASAITAGVDFVQGLVNGITKGYEVVKTAAKGLGKAALSAVKGVLGISSPSRVMLGFGVHTARGFALGVRAAVPEVRTASIGIGAAATGGASEKIGSYAPQGGTGGEGATRSAGRPAIHIDVGGIHIDGAGKGVEELTETAVALIFERLALQAGL